MRRDRGVQPIDIALTIFGALFCVALAIIILIIASRDGNAEDRGAWFKSLKQPATGASCCDISDCRRTEATLNVIQNAAGERVDQWIADVEGEMTPIPSEKVLDKKSIDGEAYVCSGYGRKIFCFVKPDIIF